ncbi:uncharacterized protein L3040_004001 [Drepanopeziza brunnea f. sp. 'multigermtubi']|uniref:NAD dependent epimerase/dehydratase n=1 Tax=Marssonina brunnea f. sp. multigermtubi (strain MB_m1) TaxID=1072389 RepID=K1XQC3_MARBU|nr:NAD dependent epimerase/dehydratase [Drepanopeziza brunnea f. sp. 'multigermtubi' MB_m1]EKD14779.1 NAD dependent epimerase/dehydratase [Drepanopeziza brunnea f. sp. 'multigermtubi' MB_m1]KAJ5046774.1 hypothetical protein L3040_004001 [Drepanopeziza brunnea f. sp. 'multigermtubi']
MPKLVVVVGATGNQGGSVARRFVQDPTYRVRGLTRNPSSTAALELAKLGIEVVQADLEDVESVKRAFQGANMIFSVTNYWEPFFRPDARAAAERQGLSCKMYAYEVEVRQGRNIADAAASPEIVKGLDEMGFIASTLSYAKKCSGGKYQNLYHFDAKAEVFPFYVEGKYPELSKKMSCVQTGYFMTSYRLAPGAYFSKLPNNTFQMSFPTSPSSPVPHIAINNDMGPFVYAASQLGPGKHFMAEGTTCTWPAFLSTWSRVTGRAAHYQQVSIEQFAAMSADRAFGEEAGLMFEYSSTPGYDGGDKTLLKAADIRAAGIACPMTSLEEFMQAQDWSGVLSLDQQ